MLIGSVMANVADSADMSEQERSDILQGARSLVDHREAFAGKPQHDEETRSLACQSEGGESPRVQVRVDPDLAKALRARARKEHRSVSEIATPRYGKYVDHAA